MAAGQYAAGEEDTVDYGRFYQQNVAFREYVDRYCRDYGHTVEESLGHALVQEVAGYYRQKEPEKEEGITKNAGKAFTGDLGNGIPV